MVLTKIDLQDAGDIQNMIALQELEDRMDDWNVQACVAVSAKDPNAKEFGAINACEDGPSDGAAITTSIDSVCLAFTKVIDAALQPEP